MSNHSSINVMSQNTSNVTIKVWNISNSISSEFFEKFFTAADPNSALKKCNDYYLVTISKDRAPLIIQKLNDWKVGDKPLRACIVEKKNVSRVCIWNLSDLLSDAFFNRLFSVLNCKSSAQKFKDYYIIETTKELAEGIVQKLNKCSVGDTILRAYIIGKEDSNLNKRGPSRHISLILQDFYFQEKNTIARRALKTYGKISDFYSYKTVKCNGSCGGNQSTCLFYHSSGDKRRSPVLHHYTSDICPYQALKPKVCSNGDRCTYSHNIYEQMFHPTNIHTILCPSVEARLCTKMPFCKFCHKDTPETFYTECWSHLLTCNVKNSFKFFVGAINEAIKLPSNFDIKVCLLSRCEEFLDIANKCAADVISTLKMDSVILDKKWISLGNHQIFLGTPEIIANYHKKLLTSSTRGALIIEDISGILEDAENRLHLMSIFERLKLPNKTSKMNVVFVSRFEEPLLADHLSRMIGINIVRVNETSVSGIPETLKNLEENSSVNQGEEERSNHATNEQAEQEAASFSISNSKLLSSGSWSKGSPINLYAQDRSFTPSPVPKRPHTSSEDYYSRKSARSQYETSTKAYVIEQAAFQHQLPPDQLGSTYGNLSIPNEENKNIYVEESYGKASHSDLPVNNDKNDSRNKTIVKKLPEAELNLKNSMGEELYNSFVQERKEILSSHESEYDAYKTFPDLHPNHDKHYSQFLKDYVKKYPTSKSEDHKASVWKEHWRTKLKIIMDDEWKEQKRKLLLKYQIKAEKESQNSMKSQVPLNDPRTNLLNLSQSATNDNLIKENDKIDQKSLVPEKENDKIDQKSLEPEKEEEFTVEKSLDLLEQFSGKLGVLGPSMLAMVESTRKLGSNTIEALNIFTDEENVALIHMVISKLKVLQLKSEGEPVLTRAVNFTTRLLEYAKNPPLDIILDIKSIARCTIGQSPTIILDKINKILTRKKRANASKEKINDFFLKVCAVQFDLQTRCND